MQTNPEPISVTILDREFQFACPPGEREALKEAAQHLDERMRTIKGEGRLIALEQVAVMTALNLSHELLKLQKQEQYRQQNVDNRIRKLADQLEDALDN